MATNALQAIVAVSVAGQAAAAAPKSEQITISGTAALVSDYRFRGVSQSDEDPAVQAGATVETQSGAYAGFWGSNLAGWGTFGGANIELDLITGFKTDVAKNVQMDVGATWFMYPGGADDSDFVEFYLKGSVTLSSALVVGGVAYAPKQQALGNFSRTPESRGQSEDNLYVWSDGALPVPHTPITIKGHIGYSVGNPGLGPNGTSLSPTGEYLDWLVGADLTVKNWTLGVSYTDTDISRAKSFYLQPGFSRGGGGTEPIADATIVVSLTASF